MFDNLLKSGDNLTEMTKLINQFRAIMRESPLDTDAQEIALGITLMLSVYEDVKHDPEALVDFALRIGKTLPQFAISAVAIQAMGELK